MCALCGDKGCSAIENGLRTFRDWNDLATHADEEAIVTWVNRLATIAKEYDVLKERDDARKFYHKKHTEKQRAIARAARKFFDKDELEELERQAALKVLGEEDPRVF